MNASWRLIQATALGLLTSEQLVFGALGFPVAPRCRVSVTGGTLVQARGGYRLLSIDLSGT
jgi:hypothetical protein